MDKVRLASFGCALPHLHPWAVVHALLLPLVPPNRSPNYYKVMRYCPTLAFYHLSSPQTRLSPRCARSPYDWASAAVQGAREGRKRALQWTKHRAGHWLCCSEKAETVASDGEASLGQKPLGTLQPTSERSNSFPTEGRLCPSRLIIRPLGS